LRDELETKSAAFEERQGRIMKCPRCNSEWPAGVKYCGNDGTELSQARAHVPQQSLQQQPVNDKLRSLLPQIGLGRFVEAGPGHHICHHGSTYVDVQVVNAAGQFAVRSMAPVTVGSSICPDLMRFLLEQNAILMFGAFGLDSKGNIGISHTVMASSMDAQELGASVNMVVKTADRYDDQIVQRWGGKTAKQTMLDQLLPAAIVRMLRPQK
jgi:hypothetical protein